MKPSSTPSTVRKRVVVSKVLRTPYFRISLGCLVAFTVFFAGITGCNRFNGSDFSPSPALPPPTVLPTAGSPIQHIVVIMQENRSFDNFFFGFPGADSARSGNNAGVMIPLTPVALDDPRDLNHSHIQWWKDWDGGKMDGFAQSKANPSTLPFSYVPKTDIEAYWTMAEQYTLGDRMFQSNTGPSFVAHQYMIAGQSGGVDENPNSSWWGCDAPAKTRAAMIGPNGTDLPGIYPCFDYRTLADVMDATGVTWRYYAPGAHSDSFAVSAYQAIRHIRFGSDWQDKVISPQTKVLTDIAAGELAQVTWIVPNGMHSDHPGIRSKEGPDWVASIVNTIGSSQFWNSTAIFIAWDDWGGWYDHVSPPQVDEMGYGFRVPLLVVSPYARHGYISHTHHEASGFNTFIEENFGLGSIGSRDVAADDFADCFDYTQTPAPFAAIKTKVTADHLVHEQYGGPPDDD